MSSDRKAAIAAGTLILTSVAASIVGGNLILSVIKLPDFLAAMPSSRIQMSTGIFLELICAVLVIGIPITLFPILRRYSERIAIGFVVFRSIEAIFTIICEVAILSILSLGLQYARTDISNPAVLSSLGNALATAHYWAYDMVCIATGIAYLIFFCLCHRARLLPRFLTLWGLIGMPVFLALVLSGMIANHPGMLFRGEYPANIIVLPASLNELFLAIWLIVRGLTTPSASTKR